MLIVAADAELPRSERVWGSGGWMEPETREALDWLALARLMGWGVRIAHVSDDLSFAADAGLEWIVLACDPGALGSEWILRLETCLERNPCLVISRAGDARLPLHRLAGAHRDTARVAGKALRWEGPGPRRSWSCRNSIESAVLRVAEGNAIWATLDGEPVIVARRVGRGVIATVGFHPSVARDADGAATSLARHLLVCGSQSPVAWVDFEQTLVLRMDDPGGAQNVHSREWSYPKLGADRWLRIGADLARRNARLSVGYVAGWVDDGDAARGTLEVGGVEVPRIPGAVYPSPRVKYRDNAGHLPGTVHDYRSEFAGIQGLHARGVADVELHGYTHMHPDSTSWARAPDRYETWPSTAWFRELGVAASAAIAARPKEQHPLALGLEAFREYFGARPTTLICPGDQWTNDVLSRALDLGLELVSSYYLALRYDDRFCWAQHVCAPYLDQPDAAWFDAGLPVVGYFHDFEVATRGVEWMARWVDAWQAAGATRIIGLREIAAAFSAGESINRSDGLPQLTTGRNATTHDPSPLKLRYRSSDGTIADFGQHAFRD
jgi:hypothetical protein